MNWLRKALIAGTIALTLTVQGGVGSCVTPANDNQAEANYLPVTVQGETNLPGNFYLSFVYSRNLVLLDGKG